MKNYVEELKDYVKSIREMTKYHGLLKEERMQYLDVATTRYAISHVEQFEHEREYAKSLGRDFAYRPYDRSLLAECADLVLHEELTDKSRNKMTQNEYPILSDLQLARRQSGAHERNTSFAKGESPLSAAHAFGTDQQWYNKPVRKKLSHLQMIKIEEKTLIRNKERRKKYNDFVRVQPCITYKKDSQDLFSIEGKLTDEIFSNGSLVKIKNGDNTLYRITGCRNYPKVTITELKTKSNIKISVDKLILFEEGDQV